MEATKRRSDGATKGAARRALLVGMLAALIVAGTARQTCAAAEVRAGVTTREIYTNVPFSFVVEIEGAEGYTMPELPPMDGIDVIGPPKPRTSSEMRIFNGRTVKQSKTVTISWSLVARRTGSVKIPPFQVKADGAFFDTQGFTLFASEPDGEGLLLVEIDSERDVFYLGERIDLKLRIWVRPYEDRLASGPLSGSSMWSFIKLDQSSWGEFIDPIRALSNRIGFTQPPPSRRARREVDGQEEVFYVFEFEKTIWPTQAGALELQPVSIVMQYPTKLRRGRSLFRDLEVADARLLVETADAPRVRINAPPEDGQPSFYSGAVGRFTISARAQPREVAVGDPITLTLTVHDHTRGGSPLEFLAPPPLDRLDELTEDFRVPSDPLAGTITGSRKTFTQTIRARRDGVTEIPRIPFAFFDPAGEQYEVVRSPAIPLTVAPTTTVRMSDVVGGEVPVGEREASELTELSRGLMANETDVGSMLSSHGFAMTWVHGLPIAAPPLLFAVIAVGQRRSRRLRDDQGLARRRLARRTARRRLDEARRAEGAAHDDGIAGAVSGYIADRCNVPSGGLTSAEAVEHLRRGAVDEPLVSEVESLLAECEHRRYGGGPGANGDTLVDRARQCVDRLERERFR